MTKKTDQQAPNIREIMADPKKAIAYFASIPAEAWEGIQLKTALAVFNKASVETEAYGEFLRSHNIDPLTIGTIEDFYKLPTIDKDNYVKRYGFGKINAVKAGENLYSFSLSSGTTDRPTLWPRYYAQEEGYVGIFDTFLTLYWAIDKKRTLAINAFNLGVYTSGVAVNIALRPLTQKYRMTLATTGSDLDNIVETVEQLSGHYDQTIIFSYPTFVRTVLDKLKKANVDLKKLNLKIFIAGEGNTVEWVQYVNKLVTGDPQNLTTIIDGYGTTDLGLLGVSSALTNLIRHLANKDKGIREELFGDTKIVPTLFQYVTNNYFIEQMNGELYFTSSSATPLVRYNLHDRGGVIKFREMEEILKKHGYDYKKLIKKAGLSEGIIWQQPFVYCFGRRDDTVIVGGGNVFPEQIAPALFNPGITDVHSFKLGLQVDEQQHQMMFIVLELKYGVKYGKRRLLNLEKKYHDIILDHLMKVNSDYAIAYKSDPIYCDPIIKIYEFGAGPFKEDSDRTKPKLVVK
jgi:phenylacetate-CoA ligase